MTEKSDDIASITQEAPPRETLEILYQDDNLVAVNKPTGLLVHRSPIDRHETRFALQLLRNQLGRYVYPLHRLDKPTSGVLLFALSAEFAKAMGASFAQHAIDKRYLAVVRGHCPSEGVVDHPLKEEDKAPGQAFAEPQSATTTFRCLAHHQIEAAIETYPQSRYSLLELSPLTGRRHQLRRHMKHISHPIIGDAKHGRGRHNRYFAEHFDCPRLLLHSYISSFQHPLSGEKIMIQAPLDEAFSALLQRFSWSDAVPNRKQPQQ
ncbi:23S RNA-specific pseudouridylate synthase [Spongiibacter sp. IMCC21906]|uniref:pseudouridine synthase n=1 Tax=Spongiibacter sp. IMCC21906 TaxID=1620392 RepID=UPI00062DDA62|nr:pseudouridine synthase [Spongiibacter sp. IMCC21906]AKH70020.1 23S RNA-specific pseudouridylate synthase [Spongiibacter sp. IMCC21906]